MTLHTLPNYKLDSLTSKVAKLNHLTYIMMSAVELGPDGKMRLTRDCKQFHKAIIAYNNSVSFASEGVDNVDRAVAPFTFRMQGNVYHLLPPLAPVDGERPRFAQIYIVDATQEQADGRLSQHHTPTKLTYSIISPPTHAPSCNNSCGGATPPAIGISNDIVSS